MKKRIENLTDLLFEQTSDLYSAKKQQLNALPKLKGYASSMMLKKNIDQQIEETEKHIDRLGDFFKDPRKTPVIAEGICMKSLIQESVDLAKRCENEKVRDAAIITTIQHMNHYNIAGYGAVSTYANELNLTRDAKILHELLEGEKHLDKTLSKIAMEEINLSAIPA